MIELLPTIGFKVIQKRIRLDEFIDGVKSGEIVEAGGFGTAAVVSPVGEYIFEDGSVLKVGSGEIGEMTRKIYTTYTDIQYGRRKAPDGWLKKVEGFQRVNRTICTKTVLAHKFKIRSTDQGASYCFDTFSCFNGLFIKSITDCNGDFFS